MVAIAASTSVGLGVALSWRATRSASRRQALERAAGVLLVLGFVLLGAALPLLR